jgi:hypothetical protein
MTGKCLNQYINQIMETDTIWKKVVAQRTARERTVYTFKWGLILETLEDWRCVG